MMLFNLADGGRIAINPSDVAIACTSPWGSSLYLAYDRVKFEVEDKIEQVGTKLPHLKFHGPDFILDPRHISCVWESEGNLRMNVRGGLSLTQGGFDLNEFLDNLEVVKELLLDIEAKNLGEPTSPAPGSVVPTDWT